MRIPEVFKQQLKEWSELGQSAPAPDPAPEEESDIHSTPAGAQYRTVPLVLVS